MALHLKEINWDKVEFYIKAGCSQVKIANSLFIDRDTLRDRAREKYGMEYSALSAALQDEGEMMLEAAQFQKALNTKSKGDTKMLIHLGKVRLGQREKGVEDNTQTIKVIDARSNNPQEIQVSSIPGCSVDGD